MSRGHPSEELHQLLRGDLPNDEMLVVTDHLRDCESCREELVEVSLAHALLSSVSVILAPEFRNASNDGGSDHAALPPLAFLRSSASFVPEPNAATGPVPVANRFSRGFENPTRPVEGAIAGAAGGSRPPAPSVSWSSDTSLGGDKVRPHRRRPASASRPRATRQARWAIYRSGIVAIAAAVLVFAAIIGVGSLRRGPSHPGQVVLTASLEPLLAAPNATGTVVVRADGDVSVATSGLTAAPSGHYYEVWLVDPGTPKRLPLGILPSVGVGKFSFPANLLHSYAGVDIRMQTTGAPPTSSGTSMLSTVRPAHHVVGRHPKPHTPVRPRLPKAHPAPPVPNPRVPPAHRPRTHHPRTHHPQPPRTHRPRPRPTRPRPPPIHRPPTVTASDLLVPRAVRSLLAATERELSAGQDLTVDTMSDANAVDPASGLCRDSLGSCSLRAAIEVADALGTPITIHISAGTYVLTLGALVATDPAGVSIDGASAATTMITSAGQPSRLLVVQAGEADSSSSMGAVVSLANLTLRGGTAASTQAWAGDGGAILVADARDLLEMTRVTVADSSAAIAGGGLYARGRVWATAVRFEDDTAGTSGGAVQLEHSMALITNSQFTGDSAGSSGIDGGSGGAVEDRDAALVLVYSSFVGDQVAAVQSQARGGAMEIRGPAWVASDVFAGDRALPAPSSNGEMTEEGGALYVRSGPATVETSTFVDDGAYGAEPFGGAVFNRGTLTVNASQFLSNAVRATPASGGGEGGAIYNLAPLTVTGSSFLANTASGDGGALYSGGPATVFDSQFRRSRAGDRGGAIYEDASLMLDNSTLSHGVALLGGGIFVNGPFESRAVAVVDNLATGAGAAGGGLYFVGNVGSTRPDKMAVRRTTIAGNVAPAGAGIAEQVGTGRRVDATIARSVISANDLPSGVEQDCAVVAPQASFSLVSDGGNLAGDGTCNLVSPSDREGPVGQSFWFAAADGTVRAFASVVFGSLVGERLTTPVVAMAASPGGEGYWEVTADGRVAGFGAAPLFGSPYGHLGQARVTGIAVTLDGGGYWIVTSDGQVFNFGDAVNYGSAAPGDIVGIARSVDGRGYWLLGANGEVHAFGDAPRIGSRTDLQAAAIAATPDGQGYWIAASNGAVYGFGDARSYGGSVTEGVVALLPSLDGRGYVLVNDHGQVFAHGDASWSRRARAFPVAAAAS